MRWQTRLFWTWIIFWSLDLVYALLHLGGVI